MGFAFSDNQRDGIHKNLRLGTKRKWDRARETNRLLSRHSGGDNAHLARGSFLPGLAVGGGQVKESKGLVLTYAGVPSVAMPTQHPLFFQ
jgi:hypothetical protein